MTKTRDKKLKRGFNPFKRGGHNRTQMNPSISSGKPLIPSKTIKLCKFYCIFSKSCTKRNGGKYKGSFPCLFKPKNQYKCEKAEFI